MNRTLLLLALLGCTSAMADSNTVNRANLQDSGAQYRGYFNVNQAAGDQMQQANTKAIAIGTEARATTQVMQKIDTPASRAIDASANIGGNAFSNGNGILGVNQGAGANNQMANVTRISISAAPQSGSATIIPPHARAWCRPDRPDHQSSSGTSAASTRDRRGLRCGRATFRRGGCSRRTR